MCQLLRKESTFSEVSSRAVVDDVGVDGGRLMLT